MKLEQTQWTASGGWVPLAGSQALARPDLVLAFGSTEALDSHDVLSHLRSRYPDAQILLGSTAGEICGTRVCDDSIVATAIEFESARVAARFVRISEFANSHEAGAALAGELAAEELRHVLVVSDGLLVNGTTLVRGLTEALPPGVTLTGGLAGDGSRFERTLVGLNERPTGGVIAAIGFYGQNLRIGFGSLGGWDPFGPERIVTRAEGNVLYELDGESALDLYKRYLGEYAKDLPASALLFPLSVRTGDGHDEVVRTVLGIDDRRRTMTFAGDIPEGSAARFMKANVNRLMDGATGAAETTYAGIGRNTPDLALLISCVGRKLVLKQRTEEELDCVRDVFGSGCVLAGFYSYGEISPFTPDARCELHNQTMTITALSEV